MGKTEQLIAYIVQNLSGKVTKTQLVKLMYLADFESVKFTGSQISEIKWVRHRYGPYDEKLDKRLNKLEEKKILKVERKNKKSKPENIYFLYQFIGNHKMEDFEPSKKDIIDTILGQFGSFTLDSLLKYVYETEPMKKAKRGDRIDLKELLIEDGQKA